MSRTALVLGLLAAVCLGLGAGAVHAQSSFLGKDRSEWQKGLDSSDAQVRRGAAFALGKLGSGAALAGSVLANLLQNDPEPSVREAAAFALGEIGPAALTYEPKLTQILIGVIHGGGQDALVRRSAVLALAGVAGKDAEVFDALSKAVDDDASPLVKQNVAFVLGKFGPKAVEPLCRALADDDALVIRDAANALFRFTKEDARPAVPKLVACLGKAGQDIEASRAVLRTLVKLVDSKDKEAVQGLARVLRDTNPELRINAALALGKIGGKEAAEAVPVLRDALKHRDDAIRTQAAAGLKNIGPLAAPAVLDLIASLSDRSAKVRELAALALGDIGKDAEKAIPDLVHVLKNPREDVRVRYFAAIGLTLIGPCDAAVQAVPEIVSVIIDRSVPYRVRWRAISPLRVHNLKLRDMKVVLDGLEKVLSEPPREDANLLRYDAAYMLGMVLGPEAPEKTLDVLQEFLTDSSILLYKGNEAGISGGAKEGKSAQQATIKEKGDGDGRTMAVQALQEMGRQRVVSRPEIVKQLRAIAADEKVNKKLREDTQKLLTELRLK